MDLANQQTVRDAVFMLADVHFKGKVYVLAHYVTTDGGKQFLKDLPLSVCWIDAGSQWVYESVCTGGRRNPLEVTFLLLPELIQEKQVVVLHTCPTHLQLAQMNRQINTFEKTNAPLIKGPVFSYLNLKLLRETHQLEQQLFC